MAWVIFDEFIKKQENGNAINLEVNTTLKIALITSTLAPLKASHDFWADLVANEVSGTNYTARGNNTANPIVSLTTGTVKFDADDPATWAQSGAGFANARYAVLYEDTGVDGTSKLIAFADFGADKGNTVGDFTVQLDATNGVFTKTSA